jgi:hypothetical protein
MLRAPVLKLLARLGLAHGADLHRAGLAAMHRGDYAASSTLLETARMRYREELEVEALARLRAHRLMLVVLSGASDSEPERCLEVERSLGQLERIESLEPPFELVDARSMIANWMNRGGPVAAEADADAVVEPGIPRAA